MRSLKKKIAVFLVCLSTCIASSGISVFASENNADYGNKKFTACPVPRSSGDESDEEFIKFIENEYNISRNDENVSVQYNGNGTTSIAIVENENQATIFTSPTIEETKLLEEYNENSRSIAWTALVWLFRAYKIGNAIKTGCQVIQGVSGEDVCGRISRQTIESLVAAGTRRQFKVIRSVEKKPCPYPPSSQQCNEPPYAYWKTTLQAC